RGRPVAPARQPGRFEAGAQFRVFDVAAAREGRRRGAHVGDALIVRGTAQGGDAAAGTAEVAGQDREVDAGGGDRRRVAFGIGDAFFAFVGERVVDQRWRIAAIRPGAVEADAAGGVEDGSFADALGRFAGDGGDALDVVAVEAFRPGVRPAALRRRGEAEF